MLNKQSLNQLSTLRKQIDESKERHRATVKGTPGRYGFAVLDTGKQILIPSDEMSKVFPGDQVQIIVTKDEKGKAIATVEKLLTSELSSFCGQIKTRNNNTFVIPDVAFLSRWLFIPPKNVKNAQIGDYVRAEIHRHPFKNGKPQAHVTQIIGTENDIGIERNVIIQKHKLCGRWPEGITDNLATHCQQTIEQLSTTRQDYSSLPFITIDSEETNDIDDALYAKKLDEGWLLYVAIADPTAFISPDNPLEELAKERVTSIYLPGRTLPMLPEELSHQYCSLLPNEKRLALVCQIQISSEGVIIQTEYVEALIESKAKLSYEEAESLLKNIENNNNKETENNNDAQKTVLIEQLGLLWQIRNQRYERRDKDNLIMVEKPDYKPVLNERQQLVDIQKVARNNAHRLIEECMLTANQATAEFLNQNTDSALYIAHPGFKKEKLPTIEKLLSKTLSDFETGDLTEPENYRKLIRHVAQQKDESSLHTLLTKLLDRSETTLHAKPHMGMGLKCYTTFTSPLRKYHDFLVHRMVKAILHNQKPIPVDEKTIHHIQEKILQARQASNELEQWLKCLYLSQHKGSFTASIQHIHSRGLNCRIDELDINIAVDNKTLQGKYKFDSLLMELRGKKHSFKLNQTVQVQLTSVDMHRKLALGKLDLPDQTDATSGR